MANFTGILGFPLRRRTAYVDVVQVKKTPPVGLERGHVDPDFNVRLRGLTQRIDRKKP